jgi:hypothetical protein
MVTAIARSPSLLAAPTRRAPLIADWPITNNDADPGGNYAGHRGSRSRAGVL